MQTGCRTRTYEAPRVVDRGTLPELTAATHLLLGGSVAADSVGAQELSFSGSESPAPGSDHPGPGHERPGPGSDPPGSGSVEGVSDHQRSADSDPAPGGVEGEQRTSQERSGGDPVGGDPQVAQETRSEVPGAAGLPFTGFVPGAVGAVGAAFVAAGTALRRVLPRRRP